MRTPGPVRRLAGFACLSAAIVLATPAISQEPAAPSAIRVGIVIPKAQLGQGNSGQDVAAPVRQLIMSYMAGPVVELVPLEARIPTQVDAEAQAAGCTHVLYTTVLQKKGKRGFGSLLKAVGPAAAMMTGMGGGGDMASAMMVGAASQAMSQAAAQAAQEEAMATLTQAQAGTVKAKDEIKLSYQLVTVGSAVPALEETLSAKAEEDGEDLLSPLVEQLATTAIGAVTTTP